jgi:hypothetical protein
MGNRLRNKIDPAAILRAAREASLSKLERGNIRKSGSQSATLASMSEAQLGVIVAARPLTPPHIADEIMRQRAADAALMEMARRSRASPHPGWEVLNRQFR